MENRANFPSLSTLVALERTRFLSFPLKAKKQISMRRQRNNFSRENASLDKLSISQRSRCKCLIRCFVEPFKTKRYDK